MSKLEFGVCPDSYRDGICKLKTCFVNILLNFINK